MRMQAGWLCLYALSALACCLLPAVAAAPVCWLLLFLLTGVDAHGLFMKRHPDPPSPASVCVTSGCDGVCVCVDQLRLKMSRRFVIAC